MDCEFALYNITMPLYYTDAKAVFMYVLYKANVYLLSSVMAGKQYEERKECI